VIRAEAIEKRHGEARILRGVTLTADAKEVVCLVGSSGSGKTTFLRCLTGLESYDAGTLEVAGITLPPRVSERTDAELLGRLRRKVGMVFQGYHLFPHKSVLENLLLAPIVAGQKPREVEPKALALLERVGLSHRKDAYPRSLSGGEQQRVAIARALVQEPEAMLFDEPTSALDPVRSMEIAKLLQELADEGRAMIIVTHSMALVRRIGTTVHVLSGGVVVEKGKPSEVLEKPEHEVTRALIDAAGL
jgi:polar amino acid transport system ATP-binding protein